MAVQHDWVTVPRAAEIAGCSEQFIRRELDDHFDEAVGKTVGGRLDGFRAGARAWMVSRRSAEALRETLSTRARLHEQERERRRSQTRRRAKSRKTA